MTNSDKLKKLYFDWLFEEYSYKILEKDVVKIGTPFLDNHFDYITMYVEFLKNNQINLTDDGWTLQGLESHGVSFSSRNKSNNRHLNNILNSLGVERINDELSIKTSIDKFPVAKQRLLQAIMQVNDLIVLNRRNIQGIFFEQVENLLKKNDILYSPHPSYPGKGGITVQFDFVIPIRSNGKSIDNLIRTIRNGNDLNRSKLFTIDTQLLKNSKPNANYIAVFDDINYPIKNWEEIDTIFEQTSIDKIFSLPYSRVVAEPKALLIN